jgi:asparagine synthase (glutamine-hydrolysing)
MISADGRYVVVFNGEIYNYRELRGEIEAMGDPPAWRGHSDTEVALAAFSLWGVEEGLKRFNGMFAFAIWDRRERILNLARDRAGEKPLYYGWQSNTLLFGSELKALTAHPAWRGEIDRNALASFVRYAYVPAPWSIFRGIFKLPAGCMIKIPSSSQPGVLPQPQPFWSMAEIAEAGISAPVRLDDREAVEQLDILLRRAVLLRMESDVPLGAFLSGGIDSSTVVALMQAQSRRPVKTFTIGFDERGFNEAEHAKAVALHLGTDHTELYVNSQQTLEVIPKLPQLYDEPFADPSQIPTFLVSKLARAHVTVALSGDGGDELFGGYNRYFQLGALWSKIKLTPSPLRQFALHAIKSVPPACWEFPMRVLPSRFRVPGFGDKLHKLADILDTPDPNSIYLNLVSQWKRPSEVVLNGEEYATPVLIPPTAPRFNSHSEQMQFVDFVTYLPDDILVKVDRASMAVSLEARVPLLDPDVIAFAWRLPLSQKIRGRQGKWILRQVLYRYVPQNLIDRPKMGFGVPIGEWLRGPLREWAEGLLDRRRLEQEGWFNASHVRSRWDEHVSGRRQWHYQLWTVLMFQAWFESINKTAGTSAAEGAIGRALAPVSI